MAASRRARARLTGLTVLGTALRRPVPLSLSRNGRILLIRPDHLGDVLLTTPAIAALRQALPDARLTALLGHWSVEVAQRAAPVDRIITCAFPGFTRQSAAWAGAPYLQLLRWAHRLRAGHYDAAIVLRPDHWWGALLAAVARIPVRVGYAVPECAPLLTHALPVPSGLHVSDLSMFLARKTAALAGVAIDGSLAVPRFRIEAAERAWARERVAEISDGRSGPLIVLHPGTGAEIKLWTSTRWAQVVDALVERDGCRVLVTASQADAAIVEQIGRHTRAPLLAVSTDHGLGYLAALLDRADLVLGVDSGPLHLATALGRPTLRLYGPTDPTLYGPRPAGPDQRQLRVHLPCSPCGNIVAPPCGARRDPLCLSTISVNAVLDEIGTLLASRVVGASRVAD